ncbi:hypothetical protein HDU87_003708 [Geranomyces variabilis]|uniref:Uncharacterized protein n=1 Tax=Geranomyces variabilis TaxID=109894 RepID=A0AAD5TKT3_9FUNG|nr:hypothetical protein HDU87_003708 [Geranomyces variabilis]
MLTELPVNSRGSISFANGNSYRYEFAEWVIRVEKLSQHVARVWFTDHQGNPVAVPANTFLLDEDGTHHNDHAGSFFVTWIGHHQITHNGVNVFATDNQKQVSVHASCLHWEVRGPLGELVRRDGKTPRQIALAAAAAGQDAVVAAANDVDDDDEGEE